MPSGLFCQSFLARRMRWQHWSMPWRRDMLRFTRSLLLAAAVVCGGATAVAQDDVDAVEEEVNEEQEINVFTEHDVAEPAAVDEDEADESLGEFRDDDEWYEPEYGLDTAEGIDSWDNSSADESSVLESDDMGDSGSYYDPVYDEANRSDDYRFGYEYDDALHNDYYTDDWYDDESAFDAWYNE